MEISLCHRWLSLYADISREMAGEIEGERLTKEKKENSCALYSTLNRIKQYLFIGILLNQRGGLGKGRMSREWGEWRERKSESFLHEQFY